MSTSYFGVYLNGEEVAQAAYHNTSDTWFPALLPVGSHVNPHSTGNAPYRCWCGGENPWVAVVENGGGDVFSFRACMWCHILIAPPHDGYDYGKYADEDEPSCVVERDRQIILALEGGKR